MLISYNSQLLQEICFQNSSAVKYLGEKAAMMLQGRHSDLLAAENVFELPVGQIAIDNNVCTLSIQDVLSIEMSPNYAATENGETYDWSTVGRIKLVEINDVK